MAFKAFPSKRYHATKDPMYVQNEADVAALGPGWTDSPETAANPPKPSKPVKE